MSSPAGGVFIDVSGFRGAKDERGRDYVVFVIKIRLGSFAWTVYRRFTRFRKLGEDLRRKIPDVAACPPKRIIGAHTPEFLEQRRLELLDWVRVLAKDERVCRSPEFHSFLRDDANVLPAGLVEITSATTSMGSISPAAMEGSPGSLDSLEDAEDAPVAASTPSTSGGSAPGPGASSSSDRLTHGSTWGAKSGSAPGGQGVPMHSQFPRQHGAAQPLGFGPASVQGLGPFAAAGQHRGAVLPVASPRFGNAPAFGFGAGATAAAGGSAMPTTPSSAAGQALDDALPNSPAAASAAAAQQARLGGQAIGLGLCIGLAGAPSPAAGMPMSPSVDGDGSGDATPSAFSAFVGTSNSSTASASAQRHARVGLKDFTLLKVIGKGSFGKVMQVRKKDNGRIYAMKVLQKANIIRRNQVEHTRTERNVLGKIVHPFIVGLNFAFQTQDKLYFVLDYCAGGELFFHLGREGRFSEDRARFYAAQIVSALEHLHSLSIIYRDLKPENILLDAAGNIRLTDFGLSKENVEGTDSGAHSFCGTPEYLAPEVLNRTGHGRGVDWWSLGALLYEMLTGLPPFYSRDRTTLFERIKRGVLELPEYLSQPASDLLAGLLERDPTRRLGCGPGDAGEVTGHPFFAAVDWAALLACRVPPPWAPAVASSLDTSQFDAEFTNMPIVSPSSAPGQGLMREVMAPAVAGAAAAAAVAAASAAAVAAGGAFAASAAAGPAGVAASSIGSSSHAHATAFPGFTYAPPSTLLAVAAAPFRNPWGHSAAAGASAAAMTWGAAAGCHAAGSGSIDMGAVGSASGGISARLAPYGTAAPFYGVGASQLAAAGGGMQLDATSATGQDAGYAMQL